LAPSRLEVTLLYRSRQISIAHCSLYISHDFDRQRRDGHMPAITPRNNRRASMPLDAD